MNRSDAISRLHIEPFAEPIPIVETINYINLKNTTYRVTRLPESSDSMFSYQNITKPNALALPRDDTYRSVPRTGGSVSFALNQLDRTHLPDNNIYSEHGLKIHIALDDKIPGNVEKGWNVIAPILRYYNVARVKITDVSRMRKDDSQTLTERGKQITIYACLHPPGSNWKNILYSITKALLANGVEPGYRPEPTTSKEISDNCYLSYRYDMDPVTKRYREAIQGSGAFPIGVGDPLAVQVSNISTPGKMPKQHAEISNAPDALTRLAR